MNQINLIAFPEESYKSVTQSGQYINVIFAFVNKDYEEIMQRVRCKDFMNVPNWQRKKGSDYPGECRVYGWTYDFKETPYDVDVTRISFDFEKQGHCDNFVRNIGYLNAIEEKYGIGLTKVLSTQTSNIVVIEGDKVWQSNCWKMSMYMMYLRRLAHTNPQKPYHGSSDYNFLNRLKECNVDVEHNLLTKIHGNDMDNIEARYDNYQAHSASGLMHIAHFSRFFGNDELTRRYGEADKSVRIMKFACTPNPDFQLKDAA